MLALYSNEPLHITIENLEEFQKLSDDSEKKFVEFLKKYGFEPQKTEYSKDN